MKKNFKFLALAAICCLGAFSCSKEMTESESPKALKEVTITVDATKLTLETGDQVFWSVGDQLSVFNATNTADEQNAAGGYQFTANESGASVSFTGSIPEEITDMTGWVAYYRYNSKNSYDGTTLTVNIPNEFGDNTKIYPRLAGVMTGNTVVMKQVGALLAVTLSTDNITSIRLRGNNEEYLAGWPQITFDGSGNPVLANSVADADFAQYGSVIFKNESGFAAGTYYFPVPPTNFTNGITLTFTKKNAPAEYAELVGTKALNVARASIKSLGTVDASLTWFKGVQFSCIDFPTKGAKGPVWPFVEAAAKSTSSTDVKTYTTLAEGAEFKALAQGFCANTSSGGQGVKMGNKIGDYLEFPTYPGYGLCKVVVVSGKNGNDTKKCEYCLKNGSNVIGSNWTNSTRGGKHTWEIASPQESAYRFEILNEGDNLTLQRLYLYYTNLAVSGVSTVTTSFDTEYLKASGEGIASLPGSFTASAFSASDFECGVEYRVYGSGAAWTNADADAVALDFTATVSGLTDFERYEYRAWAKTTSGEKAYGEVKTFTLSDKNGCIRLDITLASNTETDGSYYERFVTTGHYIPACSTKTSALTEEVGFNLPADKDQLLSFRLFSKSANAYGYRTASSTTKFHGFTINYNDTNLGYLKLPEISGMKLYGVQAKFRDTGTTASLHSSVNTTTCAGTGLIDTFTSTAKNQSFSKYAGADTPWTTSVYICAESKAVSITFLELRYVLD